MVFSPTPGQPPPPSQHPPEDGAPILTEYQWGIIEGKETSQERGGGGGEVVWNEEGQQLIDDAKLSVGARLSNHTGLPACLLLTCQQLVERGLDPTPKGSSARAVG